MMDVFQTGRLYAEQMHDLILNVVRAFHEHPGDLTEDEIKSLSSTDGDLEARERVRLEIMTRRGEG